MSLHTPRLALFALVALATACSAPPHRSAGGPPASGAAAPGAKAPSGEAPGGEAPRTAVPGAAYRIDSARSELRVLVYRAGPLAHLGHNHVIVNRSLVGTVVYANGVTGSSFDMSIPVEAFGVDDGAMRAQEGDDFAGAVPDEAKQGTLRNMLGPALLDAEHHPSIELRSTAVVQSGSVITATLEANIAGHASTWSVPFNVDGGPREIHAGGELTLRQTDLGLTPFSILLGAIQVQNEVRIKFTIVAVPAA